MIGFWIVMSPPAIGADIWTVVEADVQARNAETARFEANVEALYARLALAPHEALLDHSLTIELPMPDGSQQRFSIVESPILPAEFSRRFPDMKSYKIRGIDDPGNSGRADVTARGFRAMLQTSGGLVFIDPEPGAGRLYTSFLRGERTGSGFSCGVHRANEYLGGRIAKAEKPVNRLAGNYQTYRIAVAATSEYVVAVGGSESAARAEIMTAINRINQIYERDLGIRLVLVGNDGGLLEDEDENCFSNGILPLMLPENQVWIDTIIGSSAYDIGHVFDTGSGGLAALGSACRSDIKAQGGTGLPNPTGDPFYIDFVAHEIGHQLDADHSFNGTTGSCGIFGTRVGATAFEPGSGSTIMAYSGLCGAENLQTNSDATFHAANILQIDTFTSGGGSCRGTVANGNTDPTITTPLANLVIPALTPFRLDVVASDIDPDTLSYQWDQLDSGDATNNATFGSDLGNNPLFRSYEPQNDSWRDFPALGTQVNGQTDKAEVLPAVGRTLDFRVTVRDNASGQVTEDIRLTAIAGSGFQVTSQSGGGTLDTTMTPYTITWDTANTENAPVSCANVDIDLLTFDDAGYTRYSVHPIAAGLPNNGSADIGTALGNSHPRARIRVSCSDNVFYDISDADLNVVGTSAALFGATAFETFFNSGGVTVSRAPATGTLAAPIVTGDAGASVVDLFGNRNPAAKIDECRIVGRKRVNGDASAFDYRWLLLLVMLVGLAKLRRRYGLQ